MYVTTSDLDAEFGAGEMARLMRRDDFSIDAAVDWAEGLALGYLNAAGIAVPSPTPRELVGHICDLIRWRLYDDAITETVQARYEAAVGWFGKLVSGAIKPAWATVDSGGGGIAYSSPTRRFTRDV